jgi:hypothetical protein
MRRLTLRVVGQALFSRDLIGEASVLGAAFGGGPRMGIGNNFAMSEAQAVGNSGTAGQRKRLIHCLTDPLSYCPTVLLPTPSAAQSRAK